ncbi:6218_t:CDS:2, partial [Dentiscutata erythropus]
KPILTPTNFTKKYGGALARAVIAQQKYRVIIRVLGDRTDNISVGQKNFDDSVTKNATNLYGRVRISTNPAISLHALM